MKIFRKLTLVLTLALTLITLSPQVNHAEDEDIPKTVSITNNKVK